MGQCSELGVRENMLRTAKLNVGAGHSDVECYVLKRVLFL